MLLRFWTCFIGRFYGGYSLFVVHPAENPAHRSQGVNLLLMVDNQGEDAAVTVRFYGSDGSDWREIFAEERSF